MTKITKKDLEDCTKIVIMPYEEGFTCGIHFGSDIPPGTESESMIAIIARGMIKQAVMDPHLTYELGLEGFAEDHDKFTKKLSKEIINETDNVIDFFEYLTKPNSKKEIN
jgi:hypothetical protein